MGMCSCKQPINDNILKRKQAWSLQLPQETKYASPVMMKKYFWQQTDDSSGYTEDTPAVPKAVHWRGQESLWLSSVWECTDNSPGCTTAKYTNVGSNTLHNAGSCVLPDGPQLYRYTDYNTPFVVNRSPSESMQLPTHIECSSGFLSQETGTDTFSLSHEKFQQFFPWSTSLARLNFFGGGGGGGRASPFPLIASGVNTDASTWLLPSDLFRTYLQTAWWTSHKVRKFSPATLCAAFQSGIVELVSLFLPATISLANLHETRVCARHEMIFKQYASRPIQDKLNQYKMAELIVAGVHVISSGYDVHIHIQLFFANLEESWELWTTQTSLKKIGSEYKPMLKRRKNPTPHTKNPHNHASRFFPCLNTESCK